MGDDITIGVTEIVNNIEVTAQPNDQIIDISVVDNTDEVTLNITPTVIEINVNKGSSYAKWGTILGTLSDQEDLQAALDLKADLVDGKVPSSQLPSYVDDVIEVANYAALPAVGESGKIYITLDDNHIFRWTGSTYVEITDNTAVWGAITGTLSSQTDLSTALNEKALKTTTISTNAPLSGGGDLSANRTLSISQASASVDGYLSATDWATFNNKQPTLGYTPANDSAVVHIEGVETVNGIKTFSNSTKFDYGINLKQDTTTAYFPNYTTIDGYNNGYIVNNGDARAAIFYLANNVSRVYNFPDANGTFALTSDLSPYALDSGVVHIAGTETITGTKTFTQAVKAASFQLSGGTGNSLYYGHTNKLVVANYEVGGGIDFETNGGNINMILNSNGNLGIGVDPSAWDSLWKVLQLSYGSLYSSIYSNIMAHNLYVAGEDTKYISTNRASQYEQNSGAHYWYTAPTGTAGANVTLTPRMILTNDGKLGIGTTSPSVKLESSGAVKANTNAFGAEGGFIINYSSNASSRSWRLGNDFKDYGDFSIQQSTTQTGSSYTDRLYINSSGNVGIGTTSPSTLLHVYSSTTNAARVRVTGTGTTAGNFRGYEFGNSVGFKGGLLQDESTDLISIFTPVGGQSVNITSGGDVLVGRIDAGAGNLGAKIASNGFIESVVNNDVCFSANRKNAPGTLFLFQYQNSTKGSISTDGTTTSYNITSDYRLKEDFKDYKGLDLISQIKTYDYKWKESENRMFGVIAHELQEVVPYAVTGEKDAKEMQSVDYSKLVPILVQAIQEQQEQIELLKAELELLKAK